MFEIVERVENPLAVSAQVGGRTHTIEKQSEFGLGFGWVVLMARSFYRHIPRAASVQFGKQVPEPIGMFVIDGDRVCFADHLFSLRSVKKKRPLELSGLGVRVNENCLAYFTSRSPLGRRPITTTHANTAALRCTNKLDHRVVV